MKCHQTPLPGNYPSYLSSAIVDQFRLTSKFYIVYNLKHGVQGKASMLKNAASTVVSRRIFRRIMNLSALLLAVERLAIAGLMFILTGLILLNVITRYSGMPLYWVDECAVYSVVLLTFIGASAMTRLRLDFAVTMLTERFSEQGVRVAKAVATCIVFLFSLALLWMCNLWLDPFGLAQAGFDARKFAAETFNFVYAERTQTLNWPLWALYLIMPLFAICMSIHSAANLLEDLELVPREKLSNFLVSNLEGIN